MNNPYVLLNKSKQKIRAEKNITDTPSATGLLVDLSGPWFICFPRSGLGDGVTLKIVLWKPFPFYSYEMHKRGSSLLKSYRSYLASALKHVHRHLVRSLQLTY